ncbi:hypothetical protein DMA12_15495 [Amycolatopsis balhimycina DSM 5908]|uniref:Uncharacterized protein n=2 Tax=Amycolatopsis balhimycina TaxID=208443 RepID=A0A428WNC1_AMYBA|nr:hypothetical protein DMA12_15495 [Amycolatopsis balhimycina DSM 5908]
MLIAASTIAALGMVATAVPASAASAPENTTAQAKAGHWALYDTFGGGIRGEIECSVAGETGLRQGRWPAYYCDNGVFETDLMIWIP